jgi:hypothetical protein
MVRNWLNELGDIYSFMYITQEKVFNDMESCSQPARTVDHTQHVYHNPIFVHKLHKKMTERTYIKMVLLDGEIICYLYFYQFGCIF